jgi:hypothetical protein
MRNRSRVLVMCGLLAASAAGAEKRPAAAADARVGVVTREFTPKQMRNWRGAEQGKTLHCVIWYPAVDTAIETKTTPRAAGGCRCLRRAALPPTRSLRRRWASGRWCCCRMERAETRYRWRGWERRWRGRGFIAVAVDHPGNNSATDAPLTPEGMALWWERATDLSNVLDGMLADAEFGPED